MNDNIQLRGMLTIPKFLKTLSKRWRKRNSAKDDSYVADDPPVTEVQMPATQPLTATQAINSRGMVRIAGKTYSKNGKLMGRRPMSRNALEDDTNDEILEPINLNIQIRRTTRQTSKK